MNRRLTGRGIGSEHAERYVLVTVDNPIRHVIRRAGGTPRGYGAPARYGVAASARRNLASVAQAHRLETLVEWPIAELGVHCAVLQILGDRSREAVLRALRADRRVELAQPLNTFTTRSASYDDPYVGLQNSFTSMDIAAAHQWATGKGVRVAVIDTGVDYHHPDLLDRIRVREDLVRGDFRGFEDDRHGTAVAGVIGALANNARGIVGVAPQAQILALKACWQTVGAFGFQAMCNSLTLARALSAALRHEAQVINMSLTGPHDPLLERLLQKALERGVIVVAATAQGQGSAFPASMPGVIAVHAAEDAAVAADLVQAPGRDVLTLRPKGHYDFESGSSVAAAQVSGVVALLLEGSRGLTAERVRGLLENSTHARVASGGYAAPIVNACAALAELKGVAGGCEAPTRQAAVHVRRN